MYVYRERESDEDTNLSIYLSTYRHVQSIQIERRLLGYWILGMEGKSVDEMGENDRGSARMLYLHGNP